MRVTAHKRKGKNVGIHRQPTGRLMRSTRLKPLERQAGHQRLAPVSELAWFSSNLQSTTQGGNFHYPLVSSGSFMFIFTGWWQILEVDGKTREELSHMSTSLSFIQRKMILKYSVQLICCLCWKVSCLSSPLGRLKVDGERNHRVHLKFIIA